MRRANDPDWDDEDEETGAGLLSDDVQALADAIEDLKWSYIRATLPVLRATRSLVRVLDRWLHPEPKPRVNMGRHVMRTKGWGAGLLPAPTRWGDDRAGR